MVSKSESVVLYYSTALLTVLIFLTDAGAIATDYSKKSSTLPNRITNNGGVSSDILSRHTAKLAPSGRNRSKLLLKNQNQERLNFTQLDNTKSTKLPSSKFEQRELLQLSSSGGENDVTNKSAPDEDDQKTLSQQVADGKYALIQNEIFVVKPRRLGIISYDVNPELPKDNVNNLGGLQPDDIWLAENHLLVLAGNSLNALQTRWKPIDDYVAPLRPVKLPPNPKIPPPFPVQLDDNAPIEYVKSSNAPPFSPYNSFNSFFIPRNINASNLYPPPQIRPKLPESFPSLRPQFKPPPPPPLPTNPSIAKPLPGAEFLPPYLIGANVSDIDEDDPSLYYPPPYDFIYHKDNTSRVPPGPLVPGIVLPPPPNFFSSLNDNSSATVPSKSNEVKPTKHKSGKQLKIHADKPVTSLPDTSTVNYDDILNEVTYPYSDDKVKYLDIEITDARDKQTPQEWIPIPASKPYFITGEKTPLKSAILVMTDGFPNTYAYNYKKANSLTTNAKKPTVKYSQYGGQPQQPFNLTTTPTSARQIVSTKSPFPGDVTATTPISPSAQSPPIKTSYYFYKESSEDDANLSKPTSISTAPPRYIPSAAVKTNDDVLPAKQIAPNSKPSPTDEKKRRPAVVTSLIPIYYLAELDNLVDPVEPKQPPFTPKNEYFATTARPINSIHQQSTPTPIVEYNYVAANYNDHRPQISPHSTPKPQIFEYNGYYHQPPPPPPPLPPSPPPQYHNIFNSIAQFPKPRYHTTAKPILYLPNHFFPTQNHHRPPYDSFDDPWLPNFNFYNQFAGDGGAAAAYNTENPYHAFFTKEEADLIDDNTKEYFTIFGKKIKQRIESTTPLPIHASTPAPFFADEWKFEHQQGHTPTATTAGYISYSSTSPAAAATVFRGHSTTNKPLPLRHDGAADVNYVTPTTLINPDARAVTATFSSFIRPIVVDDLPADLHKRLNGITNLQKVRSDRLAAQNYYAPIYRRYDKIRQTDASVPVSLRDYPSPPAATNRDAKYIDSRRSSIAYKRADDYREYGERTDTHAAKPPISLKNDILVNYKNRNQFATNPNAEYIGDSSKQTTNRNVDWSDSSGKNTISYKYPAAERGHYYFLTPAQTRYNDIENKRDDLPSSNAEKSNEYFSKRITRTSLSSSLAESQPKGQLR